LRLQLNRVLTIKTNAIIFIQALYGTIPWSVITVFLTDFLSQDIGLTINQATYVVLLFGIGSMVGGLFGGFIGSFVYSTFGAVSLPIVAGVAQMSASLPLLYLINTLLVHPDASADPEAPPPAIEIDNIITLFALLSGFFASMAGPNIKAMLVNVNQIYTRASALTFAYLFDSLAKGIAPTLISIAIGYYGDRVSIFNTAIVSWIFAGTVLLLATTSIDSDEKTAKSKAASAASPSSPMADYPVASTRTFESNSVKQR